MHKITIQRSNKVLRTLVLLPFLAQTFISPILALEELIPETDVIEVDIPIDISEDILDEGIATGPEEDIVEPEAPVIEEEIQPVWLKNGYVAITNDVIVLGEVYTAPQNSAVSLIFTKLPEESGYLTIKEITLTEDEIDVTGALSNVAYDITTDMVDGTYEYDLTLPTTSNDVIVVYAESRNELLTDVKEVSNTIVDKGDIVKIENLDHFSIWMTSKGIKPTVSPTLDGTTLSLTQTITGPCMEDAYGGNLNCTANDVWIANVTNVEIIDDGCKYPGDTVTFRATWDVQSNASQRYNVGLYFATAGQSDALNGTCSVSTLPYSPTPPWFDFDSNACGDISSSSSVHPEIELTVQCLDPDGDNILNVPYCTSWHQQVTPCSSPEDAIPLNAAKCNCDDGFEVPITVPFSAHIEVIKEIVPSDDLGRFNLLLDGNIEKDNAGDGDSTGMIEVSAGTNENPGDSHTVSETAYLGTDLNDYSTSISCIERGTSNVVVSSQDTGPLTIPVGEDDDIVCTITNALKTGSIHVNKSIDTDGDGVFESDNTLANGLGFSWSVDGGGSYQMGESVEFPIGTNYEVYENSVLGYHLAGWYYGEGSCDSPDGSNMPVPIDVYTDQTSSITFCNAIDTGSIIVDKITDPSGSLQSFGFITTGSGYSNFSLTDSDLPNNQTLVPGVYSISESVPTGWDLTNAVCSDGSPVNAINLSAGEIVTCEFTNTQRGRISGYKYDDTDGDYLTTDDRTGLGGWTIELWQDGNEIDSTITAGNGFYLFENLEPGIYQLKEALKIGWKILYPTSNTLDVTLVPGENDTGNDFINVEYASIKIIKIVSPTSLEDFDFTVTSIPLEYEDFTTLGNGDSFTFSGLIPGTYNIVETVNPDYLVSIVCGGIQQTPGINAFMATLTSGQNLECTFTNTRNTGTLRIVKELTNNNGGILNEEDFSFKINDGSDIYFESDGVNETIVPTGRYTVVENLAEGYTTTHDNCTDVEVISGEVTTCIISNDDIPPTLTLIKEVRNDNGGNVEPTDWIVSATGPTPISDNGTVTSDSTFKAGTYTLSESSSVTGYTPTSWSCIKNGEPAVEGSTIMMELADTAVCTITNDDIAPTLTIIKNVVNNDNGNAQPDDFLLTVDGNSVLSGIKHTYLANTTYIIAETQLTGYEFISITGDDKCPSVLGGEITLDEGDDIVCTITNNDIAPSLTIIKNVINDDNGNAQPNDFLLTVDGNGVLSSIKHTYLANTAYIIDETQLTGYDFVSITGDDKCPDVLGGEITLDEGDDITCTITNDDIAPTLTVIKNVINNNGGTAGVNEFGLMIGSTHVASAETLPVLANTPITIDEIGLAGYSFASITGDDKCPSILGDTVTLDEGENISCTITNDDIPPTLTLIKEVTNGDGGNAEPTDWIVSATGPTPISSNGTVTSDSTFKAGTYTLSESSSVTGYTPTSWSCIKNGEPAVEGSTIMMELADTAVCTIINDDIAPTLTVVKNVINDNGGNGTIEDFEIKIGTSLLTFGSGVVEGDTTIYATNPLVVVSGVSYFLSEKDLLGYEDSGWECEDNDNPDVVVNNPVILNPGQNVTCTITNDDVAPTLTIIKTVLNNNGGTKGVSDFNLYIDDISAISGVSYSVEANEEILVSEDTLTGYTASSWGGDCSTDGKIILLSGENKTCTITNDDIAPTLKLEKNVTNDNGGSKSAGSWDLTASGAELGFTDKGDSTTFHTVEAGVEYTLSESTIPGYSASNWSCNGGVLSGNTITLGLDEDVTCAITNDDIAPILTLVKEVRNDNGGDAVATDWVVSADGPTLISGNGTVTSDSTFKAGAYTLSEDSLITGYTPSGWSCVKNDELAVEGSTITMGLADTAICTITNDDQPGTIIVRKKVVDSGGKDEGIYSDTEFGVILNGDIPNLQKISDIGEESLSATFDNLHAGFYTLQEIPEDGFISQGCHLDERSETPRIPQKGDFELANGQTLEIVCTNMIVEPVLQIEKSNNTLGIDRSAGDSVVYTLTVTAPTTPEEGEYILEDVQVTDILPAGFVYRASSWTASKNGLDLPVGEPTYDGTTPAIWNLGDIKEGDVIVLTYTADISFTQDPGLYEDLAWVKGISLIGDMVLGNIDTGIFVGTEVNVIIDYIEEGEVLGATDHIILPDTGANTILTLGALILMISGFFMIFLNPKKKSYLLSIAIIGMLGLSLTPVSAGSLEDLIVRIEQPKTPINTSDFKIGFVTLNTSGSNINVQCFETIHGLFDLYTGVNSGDCVVDDSVITTDGTYEFYVIATDGIKTETSDKVSVVIDSTDPAPITDYEKTESGCTNILTFTTGEGTTKVQIFRSEESSFTANSSTFIKELAVGPNQQITHSDTTASCGVIYYYAIRALDDAENTSTFVADKVVVITTETVDTVETEEEGEVFGEKVSDDDETDTTEEKIESEETSTEEETSTIEEEGEVKGETEETVKEEESDEWNWWQYTILSAGIILLVYVTYSYVRRERQKNSF